MKEAHHIADDIQNTIIFFVGDQLCGLDITHAREINRNTHITPVPRSPAYVRGVLNLRGQVITVIDLRTVFGLAPIDISPVMRIIVIRTGSEGVGLLVERVDDIVSVKKSDLVPPPSNLDTRHSEFFSSVYKTDTGLIGIVDIDKILTGNAS